MATDTVSAAVPMPPEPPNGTPAATNSNASATRGFLASMVSSVEPARPTTFNLAPTTGDPTQTDAQDGVLDRSAPGLSSASFRDAQDAAGKDPSGEKRKGQGSIWKAWWLAGAQRWAKGGATANKRLDLKKAKAQAHQVKESRTTTATHSSGLPVRNSVGAGGGSKGNDSKSGANNRKGPVNGSKNSPGGSGSRGAHGGGSGAHGGGAGKQTDGHGKGPASKGPATNGGKGSAGPKGGSGSDSSGKNSGADGRKNHAGHDVKQPKTTGDKGPGKTPGAGGGSGTSGKQGAAGKGGAAGKDGKSGGPGSAGTGNAGGPGHNLGKGNPGKGKPGDKQHDTRTPLEKSREIGHGDGSAVRNVIDHVKAYKDGARDGYHDKRDENAKDHTRLDKAHTDHKTKDKDDDATKTGRPQAGIVTEKEDDGVTTDVKPLTVTTIDANTLTLGTDGARASVGRRELRNFKQYERKLEVKETVLQQIAEACTQLEKQAENEAKECQDLAEQAKGVAGGEKVVAQLNKLAEAAKNQAAEAAELTKRARRAAEMCKVVLTNIQTRYAPLYKAVVDSDETKPAELRFYNDKGSYAPAA